MSSKLKVFFILGVLLPLILLSVSYSMSAEDYWNFYKKYINTMEFLDPVDRENVVLSGSSASGFSFMAESDIVFDYNHSIAYWHLNPTGVLFHALDLPIVTFSFRFVKEELKSSDPNAAYVDFEYPILSMTHVNGDDMLVLDCNVNPGAPGTEEQDRITFFWLRIKFNPVNMTTEIQNLDIIEGSGTNILLSPGTVWNNDIKISIIPAVYSLMYELNNETIIDAVFGFYTIVNTGSSSSGFAVAWKSLVFTGQNITEFRQYLDEFRNWWIWVGLGYFARTDSLRIKYLEPNNDLANGSYVIISYKDIGVYNSWIDVNKYYSDLVKGVLPEYNYTSLINMANSGVYSLDPSRLILLFSYVIGIIVPGAFLRRQYEFVAAALGVGLTGVLMYVLLNDLSFIVLSGLLLGMMVFYHARH